MAITREPGSRPGEDHVAEGPVQMLHVLDEDNATLANFATDRPGWALERIFETRSRLGCHFAKRPIAGA